MQRVILHWTAGQHTPSEADRPHYHFLIDGTGQVHDGLYPPEANERIVAGYAAHTRGCNTGSIGVSLCAMHGARERPFDAGRFPVTPEQIEALVPLVGRLCRKYGIPVTERTVLSHAEVQPTLGIAQRGKWDIAWLPGMDAPASPVFVGEQIRAKVRAWMQDVPEVAFFTPISKPDSWWKEVLKWFRKS